MRDVSPLEVEPDAWCPWCGDPLPEPEERHARKRFCNRQCQDAFFNDLTAERRRAARAGRSCAHCGGTIADSRPASAIYCGSECATRRLVASRQKPKPPRSCAWCGAELSPFDVAGKRFCGRACNVDFQNDQAKKRRAVRRTTKGETS